MKEKRKYSLTAKERKALRREQEKKKDTTVSTTDVAARENAEQAMVAAQKSNKRSAALIFAIVAISVVLILTAVLTPVIAFVVNPYRGMDIVVARFKLSNGMTLEYEIQESEYDIAATNFIFLAKNGYFDNTVFYDAQNGWLRFGGYEAQPSSNYTSSDFNRTKHHKDNADYCQNFAPLDNKRFERVTYKFGYRLRADRNGTDAKLLEQEGVLAFLYSDTATEFQMSYMPQATNLINNLGSNGNVTTNELNPTMVGKALNDETLENIKAISAMAKLNENMTSGYMWRPPTPDIMIESVKVFNLDGAKWDKFDFIEYVREDTEDGRRLSQWIGNV